MLSNISYRDVVAGVAHLHELNFIHRDLKPQNVLIVEEKNYYYAKVSDMGISKRLVGDMSSLTHHATGVYLSLLCNLHMCAHLLSQVLM